MPKSVWPLFDLRIHSPRLVLRLPTDDDIPGLIEVAKRGVHDPSTMPFANPWTDRPSPELERGTFQWHWRGRAEWSPENWRLGLGVFLDGSPIGAQDVAAKEFAKLRTIVSGSWLGREFQGRGYGKEMRSSMLHFAFEGLGAEVAESEAWDTNAQSIGVSTGLGYERNGIVRRPDPRGGEGYVTAIRFRLTRERWKVTERPPVEIEGLEGCREMFGLPSPGR